MPRSLSAVVATSIASALIAGSATVAHADARAPAHKHVVRLRRPPAAAATTASPSPSPSATPGGPLVYGGGKVETAPAIYLVFWGAEWQTGFTTGGYTSAQAQTYIHDFFAGLGGTPWMGADGEYCMGAATGSTSCAAGSTGIGNPTGQLRGVWTDTTSVPVTPVDADISGEAARAFAHFNSDAGAVYYVFTPTGKSESGFGDTICGWHAYDSSVMPAPYAYVPYEPDAGTHCGMNNVNGNDAYGHGYFDGFSIIGGHEYQEAVTDPLPSTGWADAAGDENADRCEWSKSVPAANISEGGQFFAVPGLWSNQANGCILPGIAPAPTPSVAPTATPSVAPTATPSVAPTATPSAAPTATPTAAPTATPTATPSVAPSPTPTATPSPTASGASYVALVPARILDTRIGLGAATLTAGSTVTVQVTGTGGVPAGATAVALNLTEANATDASYLSVFPGHTPVPTTSTLNFLPGTQAANLAVVRLATDGSVGLYNANGRVDAMFDVEGYFTAAPAAGGGLFQPLSAPARIYDSRNTGGPLGAGETRIIPAAGVAGIPAQGAGALVLNVTSAFGTASSYLSVTPDGSSAVSTVNFAASDVRPNRAIVRLDPQGQLHVYNSQGRVDFFIDVAGWITSPGVAGGSGYSGSPPVRIVDTRDGTGGRATPLGAGQTMRIPVAGAGIVPVGATAVVVNITVTDPTAPSYLTAFPGATRPVASDLNYRAGQTVPNLAVVRLAPDGTFSLYNDQGEADVIVDVQGWYAPA